MAPEADGGLHLEVRSAADDGGWRRAFRRDRDEVVEQVIAASITARSAESARGWLVVEFDGLLVGHRKERFVDEGPFAQRSRLAHDDDVSVPSIGLRVGPWSTVVLTLLVCACRPDRPGVEGHSYLELGALPSRSDAGAQPTWDWSAVFELLGSCEIEWLRIAGSPLAALPESARALRRVRRLAIQSAALTSLPEFVAELEALEELWLDDNRLTSLPSAFAAHPRLRNIVLFANPIERNELDRLRASMPHVTIDG